MNIEFLVNYLEILVGIWNMNQISVIFSVCCAKSINCEKNQFMILEFKQFDSEHRTNKSIDTGWVSSN